MASSCADWRGPPPLRVRLLDDRALFGESLATATASVAPDIRLERMNYREALADPAAAVSGCDIVLVRIHRSGLDRGPGGRTLAAVLASHPHPPVAVLADGQGPRLRKAGVLLGLAGILSTALSLNSVIDALRRMRPAGADGPAVPPDER